MTTIDWNRLRGKICGTVVVRSDAHYAARREELVWNAVKPNRFPAAIAQVTNEGDVREAVLFARDNGLKVVVRGGGHNWNGAQLRDDVLVVDLSRLNDVHIDEVRQKAIIQPVVTNAQTVAALKEKGLGFPVGDCPTVSASGYLLGGGLGLNLPLWGTACQSVEAVHLVNAKGETLVADAVHNTDLYWAARGSAQGFPGIITRYHLKVHPLPKVIRQSVLVYRLDESQEFADWLSRFVNDLPPTVQTNTLITSPLLEKYAKDVALGCLGNILGGPVRFLLKLFPRGHVGDHKGWLVSINGAFAETEEEAEQLLAPFKDPPLKYKPVFHDHCIPTSFWQFNAFTGTLFPKGRRYIVDYHWVTCSLGEAVKLLTAQFKKNLDVDSFILIASYQVPPAEMLDPESACFSMSSHNLVGTYGIGDEEDEDLGNREWVAELRDLLEPISRGLYVGEADLEAWPGRAAQCYSPESWAKLREIKRKYDPEDFFVWFLGDESPNRDPR